MQGHAAAPGRQHPPVPDAVERRYLRIHDSYLFPDRTLAFIDDGSRIRVRTENREVMHSVVAIAQQRGWRMIEVRGTEAFRQGIWREAALQGIQVKGYEPHETEKQQVARSQAQRRDGDTRSRGEPGNSGRDPTPQSESAPNGRFAASYDGATRQDADGRPRAARNGARTPIVGILVAAAAASYRFDPQQRMSFYVMVRTEVGDRTVWGTDLERALAESTSQPRIGAAIVLSRQGTTAVDVRVPDHNEAGDLVGEKKIVAQRARWGIETIDHMRLLQQQSDLFRSGRDMPPASLETQPNLAAATAGARLAQQYAQRVTADGPSQQRLVQAIRDQLAEALAQGRDIHLPATETADRQQPTRQQSRQRGGRGREEPVHERF
ncbi:hypothetical protein DBA29_26710 [Xenophilus aerolatus]|nr:hypothetical protein [Xenophilus aerolatus]